MFSAMRLSGFKSSFAAWGPIARPNVRPWRRAFLIAPFAIVLLTLVVSAAEKSSGTAGPTIEGKRPVGTVEMREVQAAYIGSATGGSGQLHFRGETYPFTVEGLGAGGIGLSEVEAAGDVYGLERVEDFPGEYGEARAGFAVGETSAGEMWLQNDNGVVLHLKARREGLMLTLGADVMVITMSE